LQVALHFLLLDAKPERLVIETTGLGHPARLLDTLRRDYRDRLDVRATVCLVDPADFAKPEMRRNVVFVDQVQLADVVVMNKLDAAPPELVADFRAWADGLFPPKLLIAGTTHGRLDPVWLDLGASDERLPLFPETHHEDPSPSPLPQERGHESLVLAPPFLSGKGVGGLGFRRYASPAGARPACGWVFSPDDVFVEPRLLALLRTAAGVSRLKGVFRLAHEWVAVNQVGAELSVTSTAYRRDSRVEVFADGPDWDAFERDLLACRLPAR
jgi:G3E family GTPase